MPNAATDISIARELHRNNRDMITRLNNKALLSRFPRIWGSIAEIIWIEKIGIWAVDLQMSARSSIIDPKIRSVESEFRFAGEEILDRLVENKTHFQREGCDFLQRIAAKGR